MIYDSSSFYYSVKQDCFAHLPNHKVRHLLFCNPVALIYLCHSMKTRINWDAVGISASLACAIHCALLPLFLTTLPLFGINIIKNETFEIGMILLAFCIGSFALYHGFKKHHHKRIPLLVFTVGFIFLVIKEFFTVYVQWLLIPAVLLIVSAHLLNYRFCRLANHCHSNDCNH